MSRTPLHGDAVAARLDALGTWLGRHEAAWRTLPFHDPEPPWVAQEPALAAWLRARSDAEVAQLAAAPPTDPVHATGPDAWRAWVTEADALGEVGPLPAPADVHLDRRRAHGMTARKVAQVEGFLAVAEALPHPHEAGGHWVDWCSGKAHLGRTLSRDTGHPVIALERDPALTAAATALAHGAGVALTAHTVDVCTAGAQHLSPDDTLIALHACGDLTDAALDALRQSGAAGAVVPCCFHRTAVQRPDLRHPFAARSDRARRVGPQPDWGMLRLPGRTEAFASARRRDRRRRAAAWRLAFDVLSRETTGAPSPPTGELPRALLDGSFEAWLDAALAAVGRQRPEGLDTAALARRGEARRHDVARLGLVPARAQRPVALWWVLDRAVYLAEAGHDVAVGEAFDAALTPRNLMITVSRRGRAASGAGPSRTR